jgi:hypothetical protein
VSLYIDVWRGAKTHFLDLFLYASTLENIPCTSRYLPSPLPRSLYADILIAGQRTFDDAVLANLDLDRHLHGSVLSPALPRAIACCEKVTTLPCSKPL